MDEQFDKPTTEALQKAWAALPKVAMPDAYLMNWSTWCKARRELKQHGIPVEYRRVGRHRWTRYVSGVKVLLTQWIVDEAIYELTRPPMSFDLRLPKMTVRKMMLGG